ncbi:MAG: GIY-YIG nuclease family protein [Asticcacaulis sp.]
MSRYPYPAVYILTNKPRGTLYIGSTNDLSRRIFEHKQGILSGFAARYRCHKLVWYEPHSLMINAIQRERTLKHYIRQWKIDLIETDNPDWSDLYLTLNC